MDTVKHWAVPLLRTFIAAALVAVPTFNASNTDAPSLKAIGAAAVIAGVNAVVIALQRLLPFTPDPR